MQHPTAFVFVHGFMGTDEVRLPFYACECFRGLRKLRTRLDAPVLAVRLPRNAGVATRAAVLADFLDRAGHDSYALIGHSMGGLVSRHVAAHLDGKRRVRAVVTLATPHHGSALAVRALQSPLPVYALARRIVPHALADLTPEFCADFNARTPDRDDVFYLSYGAARPRNEMPFWARPWWSLLAVDGGENDGQVTVASARWTGFQDEVLRADHWELLGWSMALPDRACARPFDNLGFYAQVIETIRAKI